MTQDLTNAQNALADVQKQLTILDAQHLALSNDLGDQLAKARMGDKKAGTEAGKLSMKRGQLDTERDRLRLEEASLRARIETLEHEANQGRRTAALEDLERISREVTEMQDRLAEQIIAAAHTGKRLQELGQAWQKARREAGRLGGDVSAYPKAPAPAATLFQPGTIEHPERAVALWSRKYIDPSTPLPPRELTAYEQERLLARNAENEARQRQREATNENGGVMGALFRKYGGAA